MKSLVEQANMYSIQKTVVCENTTYNELSNLSGIHVMSSTVRMSSYTIHS